MTTISRGLGIAMLALVVACVSASADEKKGRPGGVDDQKPALRPAAIEANAETVAADFKADLLKAIDKYTPKAPKSATELFVGPGAPPISNLDLYGRGVRITGIVDKTEWSRLRAPVGKELHRRITLKNSGGFTIALVGPVNGEGDEAVGYVKTTTTDIVRNKEITFDCTTIVLRKPAAGALAAGGENASKPPAKATEAWREGSVWTGTHKAVKPPGGAERAKLLVTSRRSSSFDGRLEIQDGKTVFEVSGSIFEDERVSFKITKVVTASAEFQKSPGFAGIIGVRRYSGKLDGERIQAGYLQRDGADRRNNFTGQLELALQRDAK